MRIIIGRCGVFIRCTKYTRYFSVFNDRNLVDRAYRVEEKSAKKGLKTRLNGILKYWLLALGLKYLMKEEIKEFDNMGMDANIKVSPTLLAEH